MRVLIHKDVIKTNDVSCLQCRRNVGHVYEQLGTDINPGCLVMTGFQGGKGIAVLRMDSSENARGETDV